MVVVISVCGLTGTTYGQVSPSPSQLPSYSGRKVMILIGGFVRGYAIILAPAGAGYDIYIYVHVFVFSHRAAATYIRSINIRSIMCRVVDFLFFYFFGLECFCVDARSIIHHATFSTTIITI